MSPTLPDVALTGRYNSKQTAAALGCSRNHLRGISETLLPRHKFLNGRPAFIGKDIQRYWRMMVR